MSAGQSQMVISEVPGVSHRKCRSMRVKLPDFISNMPMLYSFCTFPPIVECHEETTARLPKLGCAAAASPSYNTFEHDVKHYT